VGKERLDKLLVEKGLVKSRERAKALIMAGKVLVNGRVIDKAGSMLSSESKIEIKGESMPYVSRGGLKLETAIKRFGLDVRGFVCLDIGASTGGFTDCLLKHGASKVYAVDVGRGQLDWSLRQDERVVSIEKFNARYLTEKEIPEKVDLITIDVSFISLKKILPVAKKFLKPKGKIVALIKPQFELSKKEVDRWKGVIRDPELHKKAIESVLDFSREIGLFPEKLTLSEPRGPKGNKEFLVLLSQNPEDDKVSSDSITVNI
jgi:23S rRNA (cytidine1920-2'-O)/16S rRNA (cytidine1409-2'-O)-methyltransferase